MDIKTSDFGETSDGEKVARFECTNDTGLSMSLITYGATMQSMWTPDRDGKLANINLGCESMEAYQQCSAYFGATVGRFCNRIGGGQFSIDGANYQLAINNPPNALHGGIKGFSHAVWASESVQDSENVGIRFSHTSPDGDESFPGELQVTAEYLLNNHNELTIQFKATCQAKTIVNLTNHNYWNLSGAGEGSILDHIIQIQADQYLEVDDTLIPTGQLLDVASTPLDFRTPVAIGERMKSLQATPANGYDHCYALRSQTGELSPAATVSDPVSGRTMSIETTQPGLQLYSGNWMSGDIASGGYSQNEALCLETQHFPDAPNQPAFPSTILLPGQTFSHQTTHRFGVKP